MRAGLRRIHLEKTTQTQSVRCSEPQLGRPTRQILQETAVLCVCLRCYDCLSAWCVFAFRVVLVLAILHASHSVLLTLGSTDFLLVQSLGTPY